MILLPAAWLYAMAAPADPAGLVVVSESSVPAYALAVEGIGTSFSPGLRVVDLEKAESARQLAALLDSRETRAVIAVGVRALSEVRAHNSAVPVVAAMMKGGASSARADVLVNLDVPLAAQLTMMRTLWPGRTRVGLIRNPSVARESAESLEARARKEGFTAVVIDCETPAGLLKTLVAFKGKVDFVICFPDAEIYNAVTIKPFVMASLEQRIPLVGYSPAFVRAGAAAGIYADYRESGRQAAELAERLLHGETGAEALPRRVQVGVNQRVTRLIGVDFQTKGLSAEVFR